jgi:hypothetical protein
MQNKNFRLDILSCSKKMIFPKIKIIISNLTFQIVEVDYQFYSKTFRLQKSNLIFQKGKLKKSSNKIHTPK